MAESYERALKLAGCRKVLSFLVPIAGDWLVSSIFFGCANYLARWQLRPLQLTLIFLGWAVILAGSHWQRLGANGKWRALLTELLGGTALQLILVLSQHHNSGYSHVAALYALASTGIILASWRIWIGPSKEFGEPARRGLVIIAACGVVQPYVTDLFVGGTDARWYAYMLRDFIEQWRTSGPPVLIGQGVYAWNGPVHPFRSAPVYLYLAGLWDWLTLRTLGFAALQHLTAVSAALAAGIGIYSAGSKLAPQCKNHAALIAIAFVISPGFLCPLYIVEAYMTFVASAVHIWLFFANARILAEGRGWRLLAISLSLAWMTHPPTALIVTAITAFLQLGGLVFKSNDPSDWLKAGGSGLLFALLSCAYFVGMAEIGRPGSPSYGPQLASIIGLLLGFVGIAQVLIMRRPWWIICLLAGAVMLHHVNKPWLAWLCLTCLLMYLLTVIYSSVTRDSRRHGPLLIGISFLGAAAILHWAIQRNILSYPNYGAQAAHWLPSWSANYLSQLSPALNQVSDYQPGWALVIVGILFVAIVFKTAGLAVQLWLLATALLTINILKWPGVSPFIVEYLPPDLRELSGVAIAVRAQPVFCALLAIGGVLALREVRGITSRTVKAMTYCALVTGIFLSGIGVKSILTRGFGMVYSRHDSENVWRTERAPFDRFLYDLLNVPEYYSHGKFDPELEIRLRNHLGQITYGPTDVVRRMESAGHMILRLTAAPATNDARWLKITPGFAVAPGERVILNFEFIPGYEYEGYLLFFSENNYREYRLPSSGWPLAFGTAQSNSRYLVFWNTGKTTENYRMEFLRTGEFDKSAGGVQFASVTLSKYDPALSDVRLQSFTPWKASVRSASIVWLETNRSFIPGYRVVINGRDAMPDEVSISPNRLVQVKLPAGNSNVEVSYIGTEAFSRASFLSTVSWIIMMACIIGSRHKIGRLPMPAIALGMWRQFAGRVGEDKFKGVMRFAVVGICVAIFFMLSNAILGKMFSAELAFVLSYPPALALHYGLNKYWTFKDSQRANITQIAKYFAMVVITFALQAGIFKVARVAFPELPAWIAAGVANVLQLLVTFTVMRYFIFSPRK